MNDEKETQEYPFSIGTTKVMENLSEIIRDTNTDIFMINIGTLVRNCFSNDNVKQKVDLNKQTKNIPINQISDILITETKKEIQNIVTYYVNIVTQLKVIYPSIVFYSGDYSVCLPKEIQRDTQPSKEVISLATNYFTGDRLTSNNKQINGVNVVSLTTRSTSMLPYKHLVTYLGTERNRHNVLMLSHHPLDYHIVKHSHTFNIIRSYTGDVVNQSKLNETVFNNSDIPFCTTTHAILGDKEDIKSTLSTKEKKELLSLAAKENWNTKTDAFIRERLSSLHVRIPVII